MSTATWIEVLWTLIGIISFSVNLYALRDAMRDKVDLERSQVNGIRRMVASGNVRNIVFRLSKSGLIVLSGVMAIALPPANPDQPVTLLGILVTTALVLIAILLMTSTIADQYERHRMIMYRDPTNRRKDDPREEPRV